MPECLLVDIYLIIQPDKILENASKKIIAKYKLLHIVTVFMYCREEEKYFDQIEPFLCCRITINQAKIVCQ